MGQYSRDDEARRRVLDAVAALFYSRGIYSVGMDEIRAAAGVSLRRLYQLFRSKDEIIACYLDTCDRRFHRGLSRHVDAAQDPRGKLLAVFDWLACWFAGEDFRGCALINCHAEMGSANATVAAAVRAHKQAFRDRLTQLACAAGADAELAEHLGLLVEGATTTAAISGSPLPARQAKRAATTLVRAQLGPAPR